MKSYIVTGTRKVLGNEPGERFEAEIDEAQERRLLDAGLIELDEGQTWSPDPGGEHEETEVEAPESVVDPEVPVDETTSAEAGGEEQE